MQRIIHSRMIAPGPPGEGMDPGQVAELEAAKLRFETQALDVRKYGAVGGGLGTTIAGAGMSISSVRSATGQDWLESTDSADLAAFYLAQVQAEATGRSILFPKDHYIFTGPGFVHAGTHIDLGGSTIESTVVGSSRFVRANTVFLLGILAREDFDRFDTQGWVQTADDISKDDTQITGISGTMPSVGDVLLIRTAGASGSPTLPNYTTFNQVVAVSGDDVTLRWPMERAVTGTEIVNYSTITTLKSTLATGGEPHAYYCAANASLRNGTLIAADGSPIEYNGALNCDIDIHINAPTGQAVYGNGINRCRIRTSGVFGGVRGPIETGVGSALSTIDVNIEYSGDPTSSSGGSSGSYSLVQLGEYSEQITVRGRLDAGDKPCLSGVTFPNGNRCRVSLDMICRGATGQAVAFASNAGPGNTVSGKYEIDGATYYAFWNNGGSGGNWLVDTTFVGDQSATDAFYFAGPNLGGMSGVVAPEGVIRFHSSASGNVAINSYIREGIASSGPFGSRVDIQTQNGRWPEHDRVVAYATSTSLGVAHVYGRTVINTGATADIALSLPAAQPGMSIRGVRDAAFLLKLRPQAGETVGTGAAGKAIQLASDDATVYLQCAKAGHWTVAQSAGTVTYEP